MMPAFRSAEPAMSLPPPPALVPMTQVRCELGPVVSLGPGPHGERRRVRLDFYRVT